MVGTAQPNSKFKTLGAPNYMGNHGNQAMLLFGGQPNGVTTCGYQHWCWLLHSSLFQIHCVKILD